MNSDNVTNDFTIETTTQVAVSSTALPADVDDDESVRYVFVPLIVFLIVLLLAAIVYCMSKYRRTFSNFNGKFTHTVVDKPKNIELSESENSPIIKIRGLNRNNYKSFENEWD